MSFDHVVFAGGGCRCFWQAGFWTVAAPRLGWQPHRPSEPIPVKKWDYTSPDLLQATWELGLRDGERFAHHSLRQDPYLRPCRNV